MIFWGDITEALRVGVVFRIKEPSSTPKFFQNFGVVSVSLPHPTKVGVVAQLIRALPCHGRGRGFESRSPRKKNEIRLLILPKTFCLERRYMPTKKASKTENSFDIQKLMQNSDSYKSLIYGIVTVIVLFIVIALGVRTLSQNKAQIDDQAAMVEESNNVLTGSYTVDEGETLWSIAEKSYNDGYAWVDIAKANNLEEPYELEKGQKLVIPKRSVTSTPDEAITSAVSPTIAPTATVAPKMEDKTMELPADQKITGTNYNIVEGDNLWTIAERAYGDGYRWVDIAKANSLANPDLIYAGDSLKLARP